MINRPTSTSSPRAALVGDLARKLANRVVEACADCGVLPMPLKGVLLIARWDALRGRREMTDVDFLVRGSDFEAATLALHALRFESAATTSAGGTFVSDAWPLSIDLHHDLFPHGLFQMDTEGVFSRAERDELLFAAPVARMSNGDLLAHLIGHFVKGRGSFVGHRSLDDIRWLLHEGIFRPEDAVPLGRHFRELGLQRAAGYVLSHRSFRDESFCSALLGALELSRADLFTIAAARWSARARANGPPWWTPHLLDSSLSAGSRSLFLHADEAGQRRLSACAEGYRSTIRSRSAPS